MTLEDRHCVPYRGGVAPLDAEAATRLLAETPGWALIHDANRIERRVATRDFARALALVDRIGALAEAEGHHPDIAFGWGYCRIELYTHKIKGLHENDFILAAKINALVDDMCSDHGPS